MNFLTAWKQVALNRLESANNRIKRGQTSFHSPSFHFNQGQASIFSRSVPVYPDYNKLLLLDQILEIKKGTNLCLFK